MNWPFHGASRCVVSDENGRPPADHAAGARLRRSASSAAGWRVARRRLPCSRVIGARSERARRSSSVVWSSTSLTGSAANGVTCALALACGAARPARASPCRLAATSKPASGPRSVALAAQWGSGAAEAAAAGAGAGGTSCAVSATTSARGASVCASTLPSACTCSQTRRRWSTRCSVPPSAPMDSAACTSRSGALSAIVSAPTRRLATSSATGLRSDVGAAAALVAGVLAGNGTMCTASAIHAVNDAPIQAPGYGCQRRARPVTCRFVTVTCTVDSTARNEPMRRSPPPNEPCTSTTVRPGTCCSSQRVPSSLRHSAPPTATHAPAVSAAAAAAIEAMRATRCHAGRRRAAAGVSDGSAMGSVIVSFRKPRRRSGRSGCGGSRRAWTSRCSTARPGCASARPRRSRPPS